MANKNIFNSTVGRLLRKADAVNEAGGSAYAFSAKHALAQHALTGCLNGTFYTTAGDQLEKTLALCKGVDATYIAKLAVYSRENGLMKDMPALLCAVLAARDGVLLERVFHRVIDNGKMLRNFVQIVRSGVAGRKSLGSLPKRLVREWFTKRTAEQVFRASVGNSPSFGDIIRMVHPKPEDASREALYGWLMGRKHNTAALPALVQEFEAFKATRIAESPAEGLVKLDLSLFFPQKAPDVKLPDVPFQMLTSLNLKASDWTAVARQSSWTTVRMNLNTFARHGVFADKKAVAEIAGRLRDAESVRRSRAFPYQLLATFQSTETGPAEIREALQDAMEIAVENVPAVAGKVFVCPDVSGSMQSPVTGHRKGSTSAVRCVDVAALVAAAFLRTNNSAEVLPFSDEVVQVKLNPRDTVMKNARKLATLPSGGTDCSAPLRWLNGTNTEADLVVIVSDNMSWVESHGGGRSTASMKQWEKFRQRNPKARLVCLDIQANSTTQVAEREDVLNIGGFADSVFEVIASFANGDLQAGHWVGLIDALEV